MYFGVGGLNHKSCPVQTREKLYISPDRLPAALEEFRARYPETECVIISTCNRTEVYTVSPDRPADLNRIGEFLGAFQGIRYGEYANSLYHFEMGDCVEHLFRVASSLDSMIVGETQITAQVKEAYLCALKGGFSGRTLNALFQRALAVAKKVRTLTRIGEGRVSVSSVAVDFAEKVFGKLSGKTVLVVGAGEMAELTLRHLMARGAARVVVANRTYDRAVQLAEACGGMAVPFEELSGALCEADIVVCSTAAAQPVIGKREVQRCVESRRNRPMCFIDIGVPRNVAAEIASFKNVHLHNIDHLESIVTSNIEERKKEVAKSLEIIQSEVRRFMKWLDAHRGSIS